MLLLIKCILNNIKKNFTLFIILLVIFIVGVTLGIFITLDNMRDFCIESANNLYCLALSSSGSPIKYLFKNILNNLLLYFIIFLLSLNKYTYYLNFALLFLKGVIFSLGFRWFYLAFGLGGIIIFLFILAIDTVISSLSIIIYIINTYNTIVSADRSSKNFLVKSTILSLIIAVLGSIIEFLLIVCIFKPFLNFF